MANVVVIVISLIILISITNILGQCPDCLRDQGCCMGRTRSEWYCCIGQPLTLNNQQTTPWNFDLQINYDVYVWDCSSSNMDPLQKHTNVSCILDGRWSLNHLTFQLRSIPSSELKTIIGEYTMKNNQPAVIAFQADSQWAWTRPVGRNQQAGSYER
ncbi:unnamed protein product, partial [Rotaria sp. Silwood2]